jgi:hypothetical protein
MNSRIASLRLNIVMFHSPTNGGGVKQLNPFFQLQSSNCKMEELTNNEDVDDQHQHQSTSKSNTITSIELPVNGKAINELSATADIIAVYYDCRK